MKFSYIAIGQDHKKLAGRLEAGSLALAKKELHKMNLSIVTLNEIEKSADHVEPPKETGTSPKIITYYFLAKNGQGKELNGTIDAHEASAAYKRLTCDHRLEVLDLYVYESSEGNTASLKKHFKDWKDQLKHEKPDSAKPHELPESDTTSNQTNAEVGNKKSVSKAAQKKELTKAAAFKLSRINFSNFFLELNSFMGWLLFFYIAYFFLAGLSLERSSGLPQELIIKTLSNPLVINLFIFLLMAHLTLKLKIRLFHGNILGSAFLFFFSAGLYTLVVANF